MFFKSVLSVIVLLYSSFYLLSQNKFTKEEYIEKYKNLAVREMKRSRIPASITMAQGILESAYGNSELTRKANNHFGIKCHKGWTGKKYFMDDDEKNECFRVYSSAKESFRDHSEFLTQRERYSSLFELDLKDYKKWAKGLKSAGYATNPKYAIILISLIENYNLTELDDLEPEDANLLSEKTEIKNEESKTGEYTIFSVNKTKSIKAKEGDSPLKIAHLFNIDKRLICKYNDVDNQWRFHSGENIFLKPKRKKGEMTKYVVQEGQSMHDISQILGIKLKSLYKLNLMEPNKQVLVGETLNLAQKRNAPPKQRTYEQLLNEKQRLEHNLKKNNSNNQQFTPKTGTKSIETYSSFPDQNSETNNIEEIQKVEQSSASKPKIGISEIVTVNEKKNPVVSSKEIHKVEAGDTLYSISRKYETSVNQIKLWNNLSSNEIKIGQKLIVNPN